MTTLAGSAGQSGSVDGKGSAARFSYPFGVVVDSAGNVYAADAGNDIIRKLTGAGVVTTIGGAAGVVGGADGVGSSAYFAEPSGVAVDGGGRLYVADAGNNRISPGTRRPIPSIAWSGMGVIVSWPSLFTGFVLQ